MNRPAFGLPLVVAFGSTWVLAGLWMDEHDVRVADVRLDLVGVLLPHDGRVQVEHVRGIG